MSHPLFPKLVQDNWGSQNLEANIVAFTNASQTWNREICGNIFHKKSELEARLNGTQRVLANKPNSFLINLEKKLRDDYLLILNQEA